MKTKFKKGLKSRLIGTVALVSLLFIGIEIIVGEHYFEKIFRYGKVKKLQDMEFIKSGNLDKDKLLEYQKSNKAFVIVEKSGEILNTEYLEWIEVEEKIFILNAFYDNLFTYSEKFNLKEGDIVEVEGRNIFGKYYLPIQIKSGDETYIDYKLSKLGGETVLVHGQVKEFIQSKLDSDQTDDFLETMLKTEIINQNSFIREKDGDESQLIIKNIDGLNILSFYSYETISDIFPLIKPYFYIKLIFIFLMMAILAKRIERTIINPILKLIHITDEIGNLNFRKKIKYSEGNEIGELYDKIRDLSEKLERVITMYRDENRHNLYTLEKLDERMRYFMHEIKTPLSTIIGFSEILCDKYGDEFIEIIHNEGIRLNKLSESILKEEEKGIDFRGERENFDIVKSINLAIKVFEKDIKDKKIKLEIPKSQNIFGDRGRIEQVIFNLLKNSIEHSLQKIWIRVQNLDGKIIFIVGNDGNRIQDGIKEKIWNKFFSGTEKKGRGMGLYIVSEIIKQHQGEYGFKNSPLGVEFYFSLKDR